MKNLLKPFGLLCLLLLSSCSSLPRTKTNAATDTTSLSPGQAKTVPATTVPSTTPTPTSDCKLIAFSAVKNNHFDIYTICPDGHNLTQLTDTPPEETQPVWSPDGENIAFTSTQSDLSQVFVMRADGSDARQLTYGDWSYFSPIWLPDGKQIVCLKTDRKGIFQWVTIQADGSNEQPLTQPTYVFFDAWAWSPDNQSIAYVSYEEQRLRNDGTGEIHVMKADRSGDIRLTNNVWRDALPAWSPDSKQIAFLSDRDGNPRVFAIYIMNADGSNQHAITKNHLDPTRLSWSPDGQIIAFDGYMPSTQDGIYLVNIHTQEIQPLIQNGDLQSIRFPAWQP